MIACSLQSDRPNVIRLIVDVFVWIPPNSEDLVESALLVSCGWLETIIDTTIW